MTGGELLLWAATAAVVIPIAVFVVECLAALLPPSGEVPMGERPTVVVLMPAHNEAGGLGHTLACLRPQLLAGDEVVVVVDNCNDETAAIARCGGATVVERNDPGRRGKSYALDAGVRFLAARTRPPEVVIILDADTIASPGAIDELARTAYFFAQPVQGAYTLRPGDGRALSAVAGFSFAVRNVVRPQGLRRLGLPCLLNGSGMAFPWSILSRAGLASGRLAEDRWLAIDLAIAGHCTRYSPAAVTGVFPKSAKAIQTQRERWEHGHLETILLQVPRLVVAAMRQRRAVLLALALELAVPPLSLLAMLWLAILFMHLLVVIRGGPWTAVIVPGGAGLLWIVSVVAVSRQLGLPGSTAWGTVRYVCSKLTVYARFLWKRQQHWIPTQRDKPGGGER